MAATCASGWLDTSGDAERHDHNQKGPVKVVNPVRKAEGRPAARSIASKATAKCPATFRLDTPVRGGRLGGSDEPLTN
jgi:hypothetical protein